MDIARYRQGDEFKILDLFRLVFKKEMSLESWKWRFEDNPAGKHMIRLMWDGDKLVGHYAVSPVRMSVYGEECLAALSMTTMTHPEYGGRGIFNMLANELYKAIAAEENVHFVWGFPNNNSHYGFIKNLGWEDIKEIPTFFIEADKLDENSAHQINRIDEFGVRHEKALNKQTRNYPIKVDKNLEYLNWRFRDNPVYNYDIWEMTLDQDIAFMVTKFFDSFDNPGTIDVDILECALPADVSVIRSFLHKIVRSIDGPLGKINLWLPLQDEKHIHFEKVGFKVGGHVTYLGGKDLAGSNNNLTNPRDWFYSFSDSDIY